MLLHSPVYASTPVTHFFSSTHHVEAFCSSRITDYSPVSVSLCILHYPPFATKSMSVETRGSHNILAGLCILSVRSCCL